LGEKLLKILLLATTYCTLYLRLLTIEGSLTHELLYDDTKDTFARRKAMRKALSIGFEDK
jgi:hypothetical protein